jgi:hypothetical protein
VSIQLNIQGTLQIQQDDHAALAAANPENHFTIQARKNPWWRLHLIIREVDNLIYFVNQEAGGHFT